MAVEAFRNVIIGSGEAGKFLAWALGKEGDSCVVIERGPLGGACPNVACLPSKNVIHSAKVASLVRRGREFGVETGPVSIDMAGVYQRKAAMIGALADIHLQRFAEARVEVVAGVGKFVAPLTIETALNAGGSRTFRGERVFIATGSRASIPPIPGLAETQPLTHVEALDLRRLPGHLIVLGGGYVGLEFAQALRRFGSRVTVLEHGPRLLAHEDPDVSEAIRQLLVDEGVEIVFDAEATRFAGRSGDSLRVSLRAAGRETTLDATDVLVATGRTPNSDSLDAAKGGVELTSRGFIQVNERLETTAPNVWAMGDVAGSPQFTHASFDDFRIVHENLAGGRRTTAGRLIPYVLFTDPELARVGLNETQAKAQRLDYRVATAPMASVLRSMTLSETRGFSKALVGADDQLLGFTSFGTAAESMAAVVQTAMLAKMPYTMLRDAILPHPTDAEGLGGLLMRVPKR